MKAELRNRSIKFRQLGFFYSGILKEILVAKSTLSLWLRSVNLSKRQRQRLTEKRLAASKRGGQRKREQRLINTEKIKKLARLEVKKLSKDDLWLMGIMLYWAEGSKDKDYKPGQGMVFSSSDPFMIKVFLKWLKEILEIPKERIVLEIYIHDNNKYRIDVVKSYWVNVTGFMSSDFDRIYFKKHNIANHRRNTGSNYYGQLRIRIRKSSTLNRKIAGWIEGLCLQCGMV